MWAFVAEMPTPARVACFVFFSASVADSALLPFFAIWALKIAHVEVAWIGALLGCNAGGELLATPLIGGIADRVGRRSVLLVSTAGVGLGFMLMTFAEGPIAAIICLVTIGLFESVLRPTAATVIGDVSEPEKLTESFAVLRLASNAGNMVAPALAALLALLSLRWVFVGAGASLLIATLVVALFLPETQPHRGASGDDAEEENLTALAAVFRDGHLAALLLPLAAIGICGSWIVSVGPLYVNTAGLLSPGGVGLLFTYFGALGVLLQLPLSRWARNYSNFAVILMVGVAQSLAFVFLIPSLSIPLLIGSVTALAVARILLGPLTHTLAAEMAPAYRGCSPS